MLIPAQTPEDRELQLKHAELQTLQEELTLGELQLVDLRAHLSAFERTYMRTVGRRMAELDEIEALILAARAQETGDPELVERAREARARAEESQAQSPDLAEPDVETPPSDDLRRLYRQMARLMHPDLAPDERSQAARTEMMARVNDAYAVGDSTVLHRLLEEWNSRPEAVAGDTVSDRLVRAIRQIAQVRKRLEEIGRESAAMAASPLRQLSEDVAKASASGRDLLDEMAQRLDADIAVARGRLAEAQGTA